MIELVLHGPNVKVAELDHGKALILTDPDSGIMVTVALLDEFASNLGNVLAGSGITIAKKVPGDPRIFPGNGDDAA